MISLVVSRMSYVVSLKKIVFLFFIFTYYLQLTTYCCFAQDKIVAVVNNDIITQKDLNDFENFMRIQMSADYPQNQVEAKLNSLKKDILNRLIEDKLILQEAKRQNIKIEENRVKAKIDSMKERYGSTQIFQSSLKAQGLVPADLEAKIRDQMSMQAIVEAKVRDSIIVNPIEVTDFYQKYNKEFKTPEIKSFDLLAIDDKDTAEQVSNELKRSADIDKAAQEHSLNADKIDVKPGQLKKDVEDIILKLNIGGISDPILIEDKYYIFRLNKITPPHDQSLLEAQDNIYEVIYNQKMQAALVKWLDELKKKSYVKVMQN